MEPMHVYVRAAVKFDEEVLRHRLVAERLHLEKVRNARRERAQRVRYWMRNRHLQMPDRARWQTSIDRA